MHISSDINILDAAFPIRTAIRHSVENIGIIGGYAGRVSSRVFRKRDEITVLPSEFTPKTKFSETISDKLEKAFAAMSVSMILEDTRYWQG